MSKGVGSGISKFHYKQSGSELTTKLLPKQVFNVAKSFEGRRGRLFYKANRFPAAENRNCQAAGYISKQRVRVIQSLVMQRPSRGDPGRL